mgnify:CR=1 FL=1
MDPVFVFFTVRSGSWSYLNPVFFLRVESGSQTESGLSEVPNMDSGFKGLNVDQDF